ncbi:hypothetical protein UPYG_G00184150 [Umbra pygmaea]|uniref:C1q domain-containing protein n=1 Tax=Umbra pygmaea TaxID=75934 RepID=A0ABD0WS06_UMBPY
MYGHMKLSLCMWSLEMDQVLCLLAVGLCLCFLSQVNGVHLGRDFILKAIHDAKARVDAEYKYSRKESLSRVRRNNVSPAEILQLLKQPAQDTRSAVRAADYMENAIKLIQERCTKNYLVHSQCHSRNATDLISAVDLNTIAGLSGCAARTRPPSCDKISTVNRFRTATSVCNNIKDPRRGASNTPLARWLPPQYEDGISEAKGWDPNKPINGHLLPLVREVSNRILKPLETNLESDMLNTYLVTLFSQWINLDLAVTPTSPSIRSFNNSVDCYMTCDHTEPCFPITVPEDELHVKECIPFIRSAPACSYVFGESNVRQQMNSLTSFIDAGQVYGSEEVQARNLRDLTNDKGLLRVNTQYTDNGRDLLPFFTGANLCTIRQHLANNSNVEVPCFLTGDLSSNENIDLTTMHTLMLQEHNRLARALAQHNPDWNGDTIYQETRKIIGAYFQVFTFRDYLGYIVGPDLVKEKLSIYPGYDENVDPSISNVFATAAFHFDQLTIQPSVLSLNESYGGLDPVVRGMVGRQAKVQLQDHMTDELKEKLLEVSIKPALDLGSLNMQRGRDHGLPGYNAWRGFCGLSQPQNVDELAVVLNNTDLAQKLMDLYGTPDNIDVWLGGVVEPFVPNGRVGPLFGCIISTQFQRIRQGDRLWWENDGVFTDAQKESLRKVSLSRILCDNTGITDVPKNPFLYRPSGSGYTPCEDIPAFDLRPWKHDYTDPTIPSETSVEQSSPGPEGPPGPQGLPGAISAFAMRLAYNNPTPGQPIQFREVIYNGQNHYDTSTGVFTCVEPGVYEFEFHCTIYQNVCNVDLLKNDQLMLHSFTSKQNGYITASGGTLLLLSKGDKIWLLVGGNGLTSDSYFSGHLCFTVLDDVLSSTNAPVTTSPHAPVTTSPNAPVTTSPNAPVTTSPNAPVTTSPNAPVTTSPNAPVTTSANASGNTSANASGNTSANASGNTSANAPGTSPTNAPGITSGNALCNALDNALCTTLSKTLTRAPVIPWLIPQLIPRVMP